jgi:transcription factor TGA
MASQRIGELDFSEAEHYGIHHRINNPSSSLMNEGSGFDFGELEEAIVLQGIKSRNDETKASFFTAKPASATLEMFPSWPMRFHQSSTGGNKSGGESSDSALSSKNENPFESESSPLSCKKASSSFSSEQNNTNNQQLQQQNMITNDAIRTGSSSQNQSVAKEKKKVSHHSLHSSV